MPRQAKGISAHGVYQKSKPAACHRKTCRFALQKTPFYSLKRAVLEAKTARFATPLTINRLQRVAAVAGRISIIAVAGGAACPPS